MNEKRFTETISTQIVKDNLTGKVYYHSIIDTDLLDVMNELHEENVNLRKCLNEIYQISKMESVEMITWVLLLIGWILLIISYSFPIILPLNLLGLFSCIVFAIGLGMNIQKMIA